MRLSRIRPGEAVTGLCGLVLLIALFAPWFGDADAWEAFTVADLLLAMAAAMAIALPIVSASNAKPDAPISASALTVLAGFVASLLVLYRLLDPVGDGSRRIGLYLAVLASLGVTGAAWRAMSEEGT